MAEILSEFGHLVGLAGGNNIQATTMPTYSSVPLGTIVQYIGTTTADYINGYFYKATATGWEQHDTQPASNADNSITAFKESSPALAAHAVDEYIRYNNVTYIVTAAIAIGDTLTVGTNIAVPELDEGTVIYTPEAGGGSAGGGHVIVNPSGTDMDQRASLQFVDANVTDDSTNDKTKIENVKVINSESELASASDGMYMGSYDDEADGVISADMIMYDSETTVKDELDNKVDKVTGKGLSTNDYDNIDKAKVGKIDETTTSVTGNPISISGLKSNQLAKDPIITLEPIQAGSGDPSPSNVRAISGYNKIEVLSTGKNIWNLNIDLLKSLNTEGTWTGNTYAVVGVTFAVEVNSKGIVTKIVANGTPSSGHATLTCYKSNTSIFNGLQLRASGYPAIIGRFLIGSNYLTSEYLNTLYDSIGTIPNETSGTEILIQIMSGQTASNYEIYPMLTLSSVTDTTFEPYNPVTNIHLTLGQTIYGGSLDVEKGVLTVDRGILTADNYYELVAGSSGGGLYWVDISAVPDIDMSKTAQTICSRYTPIHWDGAWGSTNPCIDCYSESRNLFRIYTDTSINNFADWKTANADLKIIYYLANPYTIQLTPHEISLLKDYAYVSTNGTNMSFSYKNGEMASLGDVSQLGETVNALSNRCNYNYTDLGVDPSIDADDLTAPGIYSLYGSNATTQHLPVQNQWNIIHVDILNNNPDYVYQRGMWNIYTYYRSCTNGVWSAWTTLGTHEIGAVYNVTHGQEVEIQLSENWRIWGSLIVCVNQPQWQGCNLTGTIPVIILSTCTNGYAMAKGSGEPDSDTVISAVKPVSTDHTKLKVTCHFIGAYANTQNDVHIYATI